MRITYTGIKNSVLRGLGSAGSSDTNVLAEFNRALSSRYQLCLAELQNWVTQRVQTSSTVASQQYYHYPPGVVNLEDAVVTINSIKYPLKAVDSQYDWDNLNAITFSGSAIPQYFFPRRDDFGIWPIPQGVYTMTLNYTLRDRNLSQADYTTGTVTVTNNSQTLTGAGTTFTADMVGRWFVMADGQATAGAGYYYRISGYTSATILTSEEAWQGTTVSGVTYLIGESPELPEEAHTLLIDGTLADLFAVLKQDVDKATWFNNVFWTGDGNNNDRQSKDVKAGLIGLKRRYAARSNSRLIRRRPDRRLTASKIWAESLS